MDYNTFTQSVKNHRTTVFRIAFSYTKNTSDAEDITQDVFLKLYKTAQVFAADENVKAWLIRVTINQAKSLLRSPWRNRKCDLDEIENTAAENTLESDCLELYEYVKGLKPKYRTIIYLYYYEQYSVKEIAGILKITETLVTTQLSRARSQLKEILLTEGFIP